MTIPFMQVWISTTKQFLGTSKIVKTNTVKKKGSLVKNLGSDLGY